MDWKMEYISFSQTEFNEETCVLTLQYGTFSPFAVQDPRLRKLHEKYVEALAESSGMPM